MEYPEFLDAIRRESTRFRDVLASCEPTARVPACPDWDAADLLWHLGRVQWFWGTIVLRRPAELDEDGPGPERPSDFGALLDAFDSHSRRMVDAFAAADPAEEAWHWSDDHTVGASYRRQAHEALIHRVDAEQTAGAVSTIDPALADDGVHEALSVMYGGEHPDFAPTGGLVSVSLSDTGSEYAVEPGRIAAGAHTGPHLVLRPAGPAAAVVRGTAADVDAWLWHRVPDSAVEFSGDPDLLAAFRAAVSPALD